MATRVCEQCGASYRTRGKRFCSNSCRTTWTNLRDNPARRDDVRAKISAARAGKPTTLGREVPQSQRDNISAALRGRTLTETHRAAIGRSIKAAGVRPPDVHLSGPDHPNWTGGHTTLRNADFKNPAYIAFRDGCLRRDDWTCQACGLRGGTLHVHHPESWAASPARRYDQNNGVTLCPPCHRATHRGAPRPIGVGPRTLAARLSGQTEA